jgi:hypothetical protein
MCHWYTAMCFLFLNYTLILFPGIGFQLIVFLNLIFISWYAFLLCSSSLKISKQNIPFLMDKQILYTTCWYCEHLGISILELVWIAFRYIQQHLEQNTQHTYVYIYAHIYICICIHTYICVCVLCVQSTPCAKCQTHNTYIPKHMKVIMCCTYSISTT